MTDAGGKSTGWTTIPSEGYQLAQAFGSAFSTKDVVLVLARDPQALRWPWGTAFAYYANVSVVLAWNDTANNQEEVMGLMRRFEPAYAIVDSRESLARNIRGLLEGAPIRQHGDIQLYRFRVPVFGIYYSTYATPSSHEMLSLGDRKLSAVGRWTKIELLLVPPAEARFLLVGIGGNDARGEGWFDDFQLVQYESN